MHGTNGNGVQVVLNSLTEEKLQASLRCLARHGRFLEIGKYDLSNNTPLGMALFLKNVSFHGILLDAIFEEDNPEWIQVSELLTDGIKSGKYKPSVRFLLLRLSLNVSKFYWNEQKTSRTPLNSVHLGGQIKPHESCAW